MNSKKEQELTPQEKYDFGYAKGLRVGEIRASRSGAIRTIRRFGNPSRALLNKINHEVDRRILTEIMCRIANKSLAVEELETIYDDIVPPEYQSRKNSLRKNRKES